MIVARSLQEVQHVKNSIVTVGTFDGVHRAHQEIVREVVERAEKLGGRSVVVTFEPHPKEVVASQKGPVELLTTIDERIRLFERLNVDVLFIIEFTFEFSRLGSEDFYKWYLVEGVGVTEVVVGYDHMFGRNREGSIDALRALGNTYDFSVFALHPYNVGDTVVSSTRIRNALKGGDLQQATALLGYEYSLTGVIVHGDGRGKTIGFPTANIEATSKRKLIPGRGVYLVSVEIDGKSHFGMMNIGIRPTMTDGTVESLEVHLLEFGGDIYGKQVTVTFLRKLRDEQRFASVEELVRQLRSDKEHSLRMISEIQH